MRNRLLLLLVVVGFLFACDQILKWKVPTADLRQAGSAGSIRVGYLELPAPRSPWLPTAVWLLIAGRMLYRARRAQMSETLSFAVVLGGGLSILWDRWHYLAIRAPFTVFLDKRQVLPFSLCDLAISIGGMVLCVLLAQEIVTRPRRKRVRLVET